MVLQCYIICYKNMNQQLSENFNKSIMRKNLLLLFTMILACCNFALAQYDNVDFEAGGLGAGWTWVMDQNGSNPPLTFPANPVSGGINTSATVAQFTAELAGQPWALTFTDNITPFTFDATNNIVKIMVYKPTISNVGMKFEIAGSATNVEIQVANTVINQWEELTFDFSSQIGNGINYNRLVVIPDFDFARAQDNTLYFDNIQIPSGNLTPPSSCTTCLCADFEAGGLGQGFTWVVDQNDSNPAVTFPANPSTGGINNSATAADFTALLAGQPWALTYTDDIDAFTFDATNSSLTMMVNKPVISDVGFKFEQVGGASIEVKVANTVVNQWEELTFDFSSQSGNGVIFDRMVIIPDFDFARAQDNYLYFDNVKYPEGNVPGPQVAAPDPSNEDCSVTSIFSDVYGDLAGTNFDPDWGQATDATIVPVDGNNTLRYLNLNYQGTDFAGTPQDVSGHEYVHVDFWTNNATTLNFFLISGLWPSSAEVAQSLTGDIVSGQWVSVDIPLSAYSAVVDLTDITQLKIEGDGDIWFDNIYFHGGAPNSVMLPAMSVPVTKVLVTSCDNAQWTYYEDPANAGEYLFAIEWDPTNAGNNAGAKMGATVTISVDATEKMVDDGTEATWTMGRYWNVTPGAALVDPVNVKFFYDMAEQTTIVNAMNADGRTPEGFKWFKTVGVDFDPATHVTGPVVTGSAIELTDVNTGGLMENGVLYAQFDGISSFSGGTGATGVGEAQSPLPVELNNFRATVRGENILLEWETLSEINNDYFELERSTDGRLFSFVDFIAGYGTTNDIQKYQYLDRDAEFGTNYYRLKQVDIDGEYVYSNIVSARLKSNMETDMTVYPSPVQNTLTIILNSDVSEQAVLSISNAVGQIVLSQKIVIQEGQNTSLIDLAELTSGLYHVNVSSGSKTVIKTIVKQ